MHHRNFRNTVGDPSASVLRIEQHRQSVQYLAYPNTVEIDDIK